MSGRSPSPAPAYGEVSSKSAKVTGGAPFLADLIVVSAEPGSAPELTSDPSVDLIGWAYNAARPGAQGVRPGAPRGCVLRYGRVRRHSGLSVRPNGLRTHSR